MDSSPAKPDSSAREPSLPVATTTASNTASLKRPAPSLLPPFEPLSSSPSLPRPSKRPATASAYAKYPTPLPTSSTGILSSSPPRLGARPPLESSQSGAASERVPLSAVRSVGVSENGETVLMGRSSNNSNFQLSANRLISRVHVKARYVAATEPDEPNRLEVVCNGWNGLRLHCEGRTWELAKGDSFSSETEGEEIMIDVQDARVLLQWPQKARAAAGSGSNSNRDRDPLADLSDGSSWDDSPRPLATNRPGPAAAAAASFLHRSPLRRATRIASPESPTPASRPAAALRDLMPDTGDQGATVQIYEDCSSDEQELPVLPGENEEADQGHPSISSFSSDLSDPQSDDDPDEENDPIVHSFGPFGANLSNRLASFTTRSPKVRRHASRLSGSSAIDTEAAEKQVSGSATPRVATAQPVASPPLSLIDRATIANHVVNQLAFSRLSSNPLTGILNNLPADEKTGLTKDGLQAILETTSCIGVIRREGKDAAGKPLESEYYYVPETDADEHRRLAVTDGLRKPSLRNCRKQHKQYYWKRPRTP